MHAKQGHWDRAHDIAKTYMRPDEVSLLYITQAQKLELKGRLKDAEKLYLTVDEKDLAINMYKKHSRYDDIIRIAEQISKRYEELSEYFGVKAVSVRTSKIESRVRVENPLIQKTIPLEYKLLNEIIIPKQEISEEIKELLEEKGDIKR
jgi:hypothetical protein